MNLVVRDMAIGGYPGGHVSFWVRFREGFIRYIFLGYQPQPSSCCAKSQHPGLSDRGWILRLHCVPRRMTRRSIIVGVGFDHAAAHRPYQVTNLVGTWW